MINMLLTDRAQGLYRAEILDRGLFCTDRARRARFVLKTEVQYFFVKTEQARLIKSLLYGMAFIGI